MTRKLKIKIARGLKDVCFYWAKILDEAALAAGMDMVKARRKGRENGVKLNRKLYVFYTKNAMKGRKLVGRLNNYIVKNK